MRSLFRAVCAAAAMMFSGLMAAIPASHAASLTPAACTVIDTDFDIDDMMAIPLVIGSRYVAAIVTSEGYTMPGAGGAALARLIADPNQRHIPVILGAASNLPRRDIVAKWGQFVLDYRAMMNKSFALMSAPLAPSPRGGDRYVKQLVSALADYSPVIRSKIRNVVIMGKPLRGDTSQKPGNFSFNCEYDMASCVTAFDTQLPGLKYFYVDPPRTAFDGNPLGQQAFVYGPTLAMVDALADRGLPNALKQALVGVIHDGPLGPAVQGEDYWAIDCCFKAGGKSLLWDESAALFLLHPNIYTLAGGPGGHYEQTVLPDKFRELWTTDTNKSITYVETPSGR